MTDSRRWAPLLWFEPRAADRVSTLWVPLVGWYQPIILHSLYNGEGRRWRKYGHYFGGKWSLLFRGQSAWPSLGWSGGTHPFAISGVQRLQSFVPANYCSGRFYWLDLLLRLKLESAACCTKTFTNRHFRQGWKKAARESFINFSPIPSIRAAPAARGASHQIRCWCLWLVCQPNHVFSVWTTLNLSPRIKKKCLCWAAALKIIRELILSPWWRTPYSGIEVADGLAGYSGSRPNYCPPVGAMLPATCSKASPFPSSGLKQLFQNLV